MLVFGYATKEADEAMLFRHMVPSKLWKVLSWLNVGTEKKLANVKVVVDQFIYEEIYKRKAWGSNKSQADVLSMYTKLSLDPSMSEQQKTDFLREMVVGFIIARKDLIVVKLTWFFYMMCKHPKVEAMILEELKDLQSCITVMWLKQVSLLFLSNQISSLPASVFERAQLSRLQVHRTAVWLAEPAVRMRLMALLVDGCRGLSGGAMAGVIHGQAQHGDPMFQEFAGRLLRWVCSSLFEMVRSWVLEGELEDVFAEFFIVGKPVNYQPERR
ncbi:Putative cytochrome P450 superfamily protein [Zea mays]|uniref:Putative cytochrome P450 superfamily protein n=1 Tax=Zea mays TaxID=4577 RepID=A0A1D6G1J5_MAIZE|nr:Putative cytochrome P450 superfamily protein [Zea mays]